MILAPPILVNSGTTRKYAKRQIVPAPQNRFFESFQNFIFHGKTLFFIGMTSNY